ncbi:hypothetical protein Dimus_036717 [Dionaea muscipula]
MDEAPMRSLSALVAMQAPLVVSRVSAAARSRSRCGRWRCTRVRRRGDALVGEWPLLFSRLMMALLLLQPADGDDPRDCPCAAGCRCNGRGADAPSACRRFFVKPAAVRGDGGATGCVPAAGTCCQRR